MNRHIAKRALQLTILAVLGLAVLMRTCEPGRQPPPAAETIEWNRATEHIGEYRTVRGPVVDTHYAQRSKDRPTFLNLGKPYPQDNRFTVVIWGEYRARFPRPPEKKYWGRRIAVTGQIGEYGGAAQIAVSGPAEIEILE